MKTSEFIKRVEKLGYTIKEYEYCYKIIVDEMNGLKDYEFAYVGKKQTHNMEIIPLPIGANETLFDLMVEYTSTLIEDRKEEKKYYIRPKDMEVGYEVWNYNVEQRIWFLGKESDNCYFDIKFTRKKIKELTGQELEHYSYCEVGTDTWVN